MHSLYNRTFSYLDNSKPTHLGIYFSLLLHLSILLFAIGLPDFFKPKKINLPQVIPIEILNISDVTSLSPKKESLDIDKKLNKTLKQKKFNSSENTEIQKIDLQEKSKKKITQNENIIDKKIDQKNIMVKEKQNNNLKQQKKIEIENTETLKVNKIKPKIKPSVSKFQTPQKKNDLNIENKIKPIIDKENQKKIIDKPKPIQKPEPDFNLSTMLKDLRNEEVTNTPDNKIQEDEKIEKNQENEEQNNKENTEVSISEMDLVLQQLMVCFNPRAGTQIVGNEMVKISAKIDRQAYVRKDTVQIIDTNISKSNPYYEAITESALATLYDPNCAKLKLPLNKYESWKDLKITIDYSWIKN